MQFQNLQVWEARSDVAKRLRQVRFVRSVQSFPDVDAQTASAIVRRRWGKNSAVIVVEIVLHLNLIGVQVAK